VKGAPCHTWWQGAGFRILAGRQAVAEERAVFMAAHRFYVIPASGKMIVGFDLAEAAEKVALEYGEGTHVVDTLAKNYQPMLQVVMDGELLIAGVSGWDTGKPGMLDRDLVEAVKRGKVPIVQAFLAKGASPDARDAKGGSALHWAAGGGHPEIVAVLLEAGADPHVQDANGLTPLDVARRRGHEDVATLLARAMET